MSPAQLEALLGLRTRPDGAYGHGGGDYEYFDVTITDADGSSARYVSAELNLSAAPSGNALGTLDWTTLGPFLATLTCGKAQASLGGCTTAPGVPSSPVACTAKVSDDPGCLNGVFMPYGCADVSTMVEVSKPGAYEIATVACFETVTIKLLAADGATVLATSPAGTKPSCTSLTHAFDAAGTFRILLEKRNASGCSTQGAAGDMYLRVAPR